jgi:hypothetical protein
MPDKQIAAANLAQTKAILDSIGVPFFLFLGTALGAYRDQDFCVGDIDDIDIGVRVEHFIPQYAEIKNRMIEAGYEVEHMWNPEDGIAPEVSFIKKYDGWRSKIDIFFVTPTIDRENMQWRFYADPIQTRFVSTKYFADFKKVRFYGVDYYVPAPIEEYLEANYGKNWQTPIPRTEWNWETDNKCDFITT